MEIRGRPKTNPDVKALALKNSNHAMERIIELMDDEDPPTTSPPHAPAPKQQPEYDNYRSS